MRSPLVVFAAVFAVGCGAAGHGAASSGDDAASSEPRDAGSADAVSGDAGPFDAGSTDARAAGDGGAVIDGGTLDCTGPFTLAHQQPVGCNPYPGALWNERLPADVMSHLAKSSDVVAKCVLTDCGNDLPGNDWGFTAFDDTTGVNDGNEPLYYGQPSDPYYTFSTGCYDHATGAYDPGGLAFHAPADAIYNSGASDQFFVVWDQTNGRIFAAYNSNGPTSIGACPGGGHAGTKSDPCVVAGANYCSTSAWDDPKGHGIQSGDSLGSGGYATHVRIEEWIAGNIPHAVYMQTSCTSGVVFPSPGATFKCTTLTNHGPQGALYFLDYTDAQIAAINVPDWQKTALTALSHYGGYVGDTTGGPNALGGWRMEGPAAYTFAKTTNPGTAFWQARVNAKTRTVVCAPHTEAGKGTTTQCDIAILDVVDQTTNDLVLATGPGGTDTSNRSCATAPGCDVTGHIHMADPCVAQTLAGVGTCP